ncbi:MAG: agmatine deiminase family protein [Solirubrobacteraceae bacterium]
MIFPAEWAPHELTIMGWPCRESLWGQTIEQARTDYATVANAIADFEDVTMIAASAADAHAAHAACAGRVQIVEIPIDDSWLRDSGPIYVVDGQSRTAVHFRFNSWGEKFAPWDKDAAIGELIARELGDQVINAPLVLEGGSVASNGAGVVLTTEQCLLNRNRNPQLTRDQIEQLLGEYLGVKRLVWLGQGLLEDRDTDGHVDLVAAFTPDGRVLVQGVQDGNPNAPNVEENLGRLADAGLQTVVIPHLPYAEVAGERVAVSYLNLYVCNGAVIVPVAGDESDAEALSIIGSVFPERSVVPVPGRTIAYGGGGPHCITQQVPAV